VGEITFYGRGLPGVPSSPWEIIEGCELLGKDNIELNAQAPITTAMQLQAYGCEGLKQKTKNCTSKIAI